MGPNFALAGLGFFERAQVLSLHRASDTRLEQVQCTALLAITCIEDINHDQMRPALSLENGPQRIMPGFNLLIDLIQLQALLCRCVTRLNNARSHSDMDAVKSLRGQALDFEAQLAAWIARVPPHLRLGMCESGSPWEIQSVVLMATFHSAEMLLYRSLLQDSTKKDKPTQEDDEVLAKATRTALRIIKLAPHMSILAATHFTLEFAQQLLVAATFLGLNAYRHRGSNAQMLFTQADDGILGLRLLEATFPASGKHVATYLEKAIKLRRGDNAKPTNEKTTKYLSHFGSDDLSLAKRSICSRKYSTSLAAFLSNNASNDTGMSYTSSLHVPNVDPRSSASAHTTTTTTLPDHLDTATMCTDFQFDGGFDPFAALELFSTCDLSAVLGEGGLASFASSTNH
ncbi:hypothetical protein CF328_g2525 [Tilletia controversa]|nr:hypothetical protein CF328_g2525 [Tilletia controversa]